MGSRARRRRKEGGAPETATEAGAPDQAPAEDPGAAPKSGADRPPLSSAQLELLWLYLLWFVRVGRVPDHIDWGEAEGWPSPQEVERAFGGADPWEHLHWESGVEDAIYLDKIDELEAAKTTAQDAERRAAGLQRKLERDQGKVPELKRQLEAAKVRRDQAVDELDDAHRAAEMAARQRDQAREGAAGAERALRAAEEAARSAATSGSAAPADADLLHAFEEELAAHERSRSERDGLRDEVGRLQDELERRRDAVAQLQRALADRPAVTAEFDDESAAGGDEEPPRTVLEAVERAVDRAEHLRYAPRAFTSAEDSPFTRPALVERTLDTLDRLAEQYARPEGMGRSLAQAAAELGITQWTPHVSETARTRWADEYVVRYEGADLPIGPHVGLGSGSGAGFIARIYLAADEVNRDLVVAHVGKHLPDTTT